MMSLIKRNGQTIYAGDHVGVRKISIKHRNESLLSEEDRLWEQEVLASAVQLGDYIDYIDEEMYEILTSIWGEYKYDCPDLTKEFNGLFRPIR